MNPNRNYNRRSWNNSSPIPQNNCAPNRFGSPFIPAMVEQKHMYHAQNHSGNSTPINYNEKVSID